MRIETGPGVPGLTALERHCRWLMVVYPQRYREERADEILDTLLEVAGSDRSWPSWRDARTLVLGGLRVRAGLRERLTLAASLKQALLLAAVLLLAAHNSYDLGFVRGEWGHTFPATLFGWIILGLGLGTLAVMVGAWFGPPRIVAITALVTACLWAYQPPDIRLDQVIQPIAALVFIAILMLRRERLARRWLWLAVPWYLVLLGQALFPASQILNDVGNNGPFLILAVTIIWCVLDLRPMLAVALTLAIAYGADSVASAVRIFSGASGYWAGELIAEWWPWETTAVASTVLVIAAIWRLRRQALL
jgi:hypothetical protein